MIKGYIHRVYCSFIGHRWSLVAFVALITFPHCSINVVQEPGRKGQQSTDGRFVMWVEQRIPGAKESMRSRHLLYHSVDGSQWTIAKRWEHASLRDIAFGNGRFVAVGIQGFILFSKDGQSWERAFLKTKSPFSRVGFDGTQFIVLSYDWSEDTEVYTSTDGKNWSKQEADDLLYTKIACMPGLCVMGGHIRSDLMTPSVKVWTDGQWKKAPQEFAGPITFSGKLFPTKDAIALAYGDTLHQTKNGLTWEKVGTLPKLEGARYTYQRGQYIAMGKDGALSFSADGKTWAPRKVEGLPQHAYNRGLLANGKIYVLLTDTAVLTSPNAIKWTPAQTLPNPDKHGIIPRKIIWGPAQ